MTTHEEIDTKVGVAKAVGNLIIASRKKNALGKAKSINQTKIIRILRF